MAATKPGLVYRGTAVGKQGQAPELLVLRFVAQERDGVLVRATLESVVAAGRNRPFQGTIIGNSYRAGRSPIRLRSTDKERVVQADPKSILGVNTFTDSLELLLRLEGDRLVGENDRFTYHFEPTDAAAAASSPDPRPQILDAAASAADPRSQTLDPARSADPASAPDARRQPLDAAAAAAPAAHPLFGSSDVEQILVRSWKNFAAQPGAYVFFEGGWVPLPKNNGHAVQGLAQSLNGKLNALSRWEDKLAGKTATPSADSTTPVAQILFDGRTKVPTAGSKNLTLLFVGRVEPLSDEILARNPELKTYPLVELAPLKTLPNGNRVAPLVEVGPGLIAFGPHRVEAMLETPVAGFTLLRCSVPLAPGRYALTAGSKIYEVNVE